VTETLTHYVVVRRDLPFGVILSMIAHAAGESFYKLASCTMTVAGDLAIGTMASGGYCSPSSVLERQTFSLEVGGSIPSGSSTLDPSTTIAVVLGARNQARLDKLAQALLAEMVPCVEIRETDGEFAGQLMAIGIVPGDKAFLAPFVRDFHMFREMER
jgi:hypothetical protein